MISFAHGTARCELFLGSVAGNQRAVWLRKQYEWKNGQILGSLGQCKFVARDIVDAPNPKRVNKQVLTTHDQFCSDLPL